MRTVLEWLETTAARVPGKEAVSDPETSWTFAELAASARAAGSWYAAHGVAPRAAVALYLEKSPAALACMLGAAYAGGFYSVLDVRQPAARVHAICEALEPAVVVCDAAHAQEAAELFAHTPWHLVSLEEVLSAAEDPTTLAGVRAQAIDTDPLYVNFTSGSTGTPKGVVVAHRSVTDFIPIFACTFGIGEDDVLANQAPFDFDVSVKDIYTCLATGATLRLVPRAYFTAPTALMDYLADGQVTTLVWAVSALCFVSIMNGLAYRVPTTVGKVLFSGEVMPPKQLAVWRRFLPDATYVNLYGPTEITCNCTYYVVGRDFGADEVIPMGRAFPNERVLLLDEAGGEVREVGVQGEVCVGGTALALGYLGDAERTAASFAQSPLNHRWSEPLYRTGDLARYDEEGNLVYVSRKDHQIKHMGQRIELGEIEAAAQAADGVARACCLYDHRRSRLHLFYVGSVESGELVGELGVRLPQYMVPGRMHRLDAMPLTKNGKIDRSALAQTMQR